MDTNDHPKREASGNSGEKKPYHKHHHHRRRPKPQGENLPTGDNSPNGAITMRPGRYDMPPKAPKEAESIRFKPVENKAGNGEVHKSHHRPRRRRHDAPRTADASVMAENALSIDKVKESAKAESDAFVDRNPTDKTGEATEHRRRRRSRNRRRGSHNREHTEMHDEMLTVDGEAEDAPHDEENTPAEPTVTEYTLTAGSLDAEIVDELNSVTDRDAEASEDSQADAPIDEEPEEEQVKVEIVGVRFKPSGKIYYFDPKGESFAKEDAVIVDTSRGLEFGICELSNRLVHEREVVLPLRCVERRATAEDVARHEENKAKEQEAMAVCAQKITEHNLPMKLIDVEYAFDHSKLLFYFTADGRVDFRELVKDLAAVFRTRIELRQIGIRDETKLLGGIGVCGRPFCCKTFLSDFVQVSIKMAKEQNLSLNSVKISGACGRLMCCLRYEYDTYQEEIRKTPKCDQIVSTPDGDGTVIEVQPLAGLVRVRFSTSDQPPKVFHRDEVTVIGGKGVKPASPKGDPTK